MVSVRKHSLDCTEASASATWLRQKPSAGWLEHTTAALASGMSAKHAGTTLPSALRLPTILSAAVVGSIDARTSRSFDELHAHTNKR